MGSSVERAADPNMAARRRPRLKSLLVGGAVSTCFLLVTLTSRLDTRSADVPVYQPVQPSQHSAETSCECLLQMHCPRYNFEYPQEKESYCKIHSFHYGSTKKCLEWRLKRLGSPVHLVLMGDLRLLYLYYYIRDELMSDTERIEGPPYCKSLYKNWTHGYLHEATVDQPPKPCRHLSISRLAKLEYIWTDDHLWPGVLQNMIDRCQYGMCPSLLVVSSRLDLALRDYEEELELSITRLSESLRDTLPLLERLRSHGVHVWWKLHENLLDLGTTIDTSSYNEIIQQHNLKLMKELSASSVPVWSSTDAVGWMHHHTCESRVDNSSSVSPDFRCQEPFYLGNWAQKQYMDIMLNFLCGRAQPMTQNPCCAGWS